MVVADLSNYDVPTFKFLHENRVHFSRQQTNLNSLQHSLLPAVGENSLLPESEVATLDGSERVLFQYRHFAAYLSKAEQVIVSLPSFLIRKHVSGVVGDFEKIVKNVSSIYVNSAAGVDGTVSERNQTKEIDEASPPVIPHQMLQQSNSDLFGTV